MDATDLMVREADEAIARLDTAIAELAKPLPRVGRKDNLEQNSALNKALRRKVG